MAEILSGGLTWGSIQQAIVTMDKEGHPLTCCNPVTGECLGGGGSSDFSTAQVTFVKNKASATIQLPHLLDNSITFTPEADEDTYIVPIPNNGTTVGRLVISTNYSDVQVSGSVIIQQIPDSANYFISITGNCSITIVA